MNQEQRSRRRRIKQTGHKCIDCANAIFDELWGEYKCKIKKRRIYGANEHTDCKDFKSNTVKK